MSERVVEAFAERLASLGKAPQAVLGPIVLSVYERARDAWPEVGLDAALYGVALAEIIGASDEPASVLEAMNTDDVYFAVACSTGDKAALEAFERRFVPVLRANIARRGISPAATDELVQMVREALLVGFEGNPPKIRGYAGRSSFVSWLRGVAGYTALRALRKGPDLVPLDDSLMGHEEDLEIAYLRRTYGESFRVAFRETLTQLSPAERVMLKQRYVHRLGVEELGALYGIDASTVSRRVTDLRERVLAGVRDGMMRRLNVGRPEISSILRLIRSDLDVSLSALDERTAEGGAGGA